MRNNLSTIQLLVAWRADVNLQARGNDLPIVVAVKQQRIDLVQRLLDLRANPTAKIHTAAAHVPLRNRWAGVTLQQLTTPGTDIAHQWNASVLQS